MARVGKIIGSKKGRGRRASILAYMCGRSVVTTNEQDGGRGRARNIFYDFYIDLYEVKREALL